LVLDNFSPHLTTKTDHRVGDWAEGANVELAYVPFYASWLNRIEAQFTALRYFTLDGTDHASHSEQSRMIRRDIAWRNRHPTTASSARSSTGPTLPDKALALRASHSGGKPSLCGCTANPSEPHNEIVALPRTCDGLKPR
jgi:hypothetical protein